MKAQYLFLALILVTKCSFGQDHKSLTAEQIVNSSLQFSGGEQRLSKLKSSALNYVLFQPDNSTAIVNEQVKTGKKYVQSVLSRTHLPQTTFFNGEKISRVDGSSVIHISDLQAKEEIKLKTYNLIQYGYKQLNYALERLPDEKFKNFDCYVVQAKAANGYSTINMFDKTNFRLLMIAYPNGNKSVMTEYMYKDSVLFNKTIVNTFVNSKEVQVLKLQSVDLNVSINDVWFECPYTDKVYIPAHIKTGRFTSTNGDPTMFNRTDNSMDYLENGKLVLRRLVTWNIVFPDTFGLLDEQELKSNPKASPSKILVRIISWNEREYVCQWMTDTGTDTHDYKLMD